MTCMCASTWSIADGVLKQDDDAVEQMKAAHTQRKFSSTPKIVVMHYTAGSSARSSASWFQNSAARASAHVVIARDGSVIQCVNFERVAWHAGRSTWGSLSGLNSHSIGIEMANWGPLQSAGNGWASYTGARISDPVIAVHRNGNPDGSRSPIGWEPFSDAQMETARAVVRALIEEYGIEEIVGHDDIAPVRKHDPGPAFNMTRFRNDLLDQRAEDDSGYASVNAARGLNLRSGPSTDHAIRMTLANGTKLELIGEDGLWLEVTAIDDDGAPSETGWVHGRYVKL